MPQMPKAKLLCPPPLSHTCGPDNQPRRRRRSLDGRGRKTTRSARWTQPGREEWHQVLLNVLVGKRVMDNESEAVLSPCPCPSGVRAVALLSCLKIFTMMPFSGSLILWSGGLSAWRAAWQVLACALVGWSRWGRCAEQEEKHLDIPEEGEGENQKRTGQGETSPWGKVGQLGARNQG